MKKCPKCAGTMKHRVRYVKVGRKKTEVQIQYDLVCARCGYVKPTIR